MTWHHGSVTLVIQPGNLTRTAIFEVRPLAGIPMEGRSLLLNKFPHGYDPGAVRHHYKLEFVFQLTHPGHDLTLRFDKPVSRLKCGTVVSGAKTFRKLTSVFVYKTGRYHVLRRSRID